MKVGKLSGSESRLADNSDKNFFRAADEVIIEVPSTRALVDHALPSAE